MSDKTEKLRSLSTLILLFQRTMRFTRLTLNPPEGLERLETMIFTFIDSLDSPTANDLQKILGLNKSSVSSLVKNSIDRGLIEARLGVINQRSKFLAFKKETKSLISELRDFNIEVARKGTARLSDLQREQLSKYMEILCAGLGYNLKDSWDNREPVVRAQYRLAIVMDMMNKNYMGSPYDLATFHAFLELNKVPEGIEFSHLTNILPFHVSKISRSVSDLQKKKFIKKTISERDARQIFVSLTDAGKKEFEKVSGPIIKKLGDAAKILTDKELDEFLYLLQLVADEVETYTNKSLSVFTVCKTEGDYRKARAFLVEHLVKEKKHLYLAPDLIPPTSLVLTETKEGEIISLLELRFEAGAIKIENLVEAEDSEGQSKNNLVVEARRIINKEIEK